MYLREFGSPAQRSEIKKFIFNEGIMRFRDLFTILNTTPFLPFTADKYAAGAHKKNKYV